MHYASRSSLLAALLEEVFEQPVEIRSNPGPSLAATLVAEWRVSARRGWAGESDCLFEHPAEQLLKNSLLRYRLTRFLTVPSRNQWLV